MNARSVALSLTAMLLCLTNTVRGQGSAFAGKVLADSILTPLTGAEIMIEKLGRAERANERGEFRFTSVPAGEYPVLIRMAGFAPKVDTIVVADAGEARREYRLSQIKATLPEVPVTASLLDRKLFEFQERRRMGIGRSRQRRIRERSWDAYLGSTEEATGAHDWSRAVPQRGVRFEYACFGQYQGWGLSRGHLARRREPLDRLLRKPARPQYDRGGRVVCR
jgi:hypothetical protein